MREVRINAAKRPSLTLRVKVGGQRSDGERLVKNAPAQMWLVS